MATTPPPHYHYHPPFQKDDEGVTPLMLAVRGGTPCLAGLKVLLSQPGILLDMGDGQGSTALHMAAG